MREGGRERERERERESVRERESERERERKRERERERCVLVVLRSQPILFCRHMPHMALFKATSSC